MLKKKQVARSSAAVSRAAASTTLIYIELVFPIRADMVLNELLIRLIECGEQMPLTLHSLTSMRKVYFSGSVLVQLHTHTHIHTAWETTSQSQSF